MGIMGSLLNRSKKTADKKTNAGKAAAKKAQRASTRIIRDNPKCAYDTETGEMVACGKSFIVQFAAGSLISLPMKLHSIDTTWGTLIGWRTELRGGRSMIKDLPPVACVTFVEQHVNGLCVVQHPTLGMVWMMPSPLRNARVVGLPNPES